jgi:hypothetical protein
VSPFSTVSRRDWPARGDQPDAFRTQAREPRRDVVLTLHDDCHMVEPVLGEKRRNGAFEDGAPAQFEVLLRNACAHPRAASGCRISTT